MWGREAYANGCGSELDCFERIFDLEEAAFRGESAWGECQFEIADGGGASIKRALLYATIYREN